MDVILIGVFFWVINLVIGWLLFMYNSSLLFSYLKSKYNSKWRKMVIIPDFGFGIGNMFRTWPYLFNREGVNDRKIRLFKKNIRSWFRYSVGSLILLVLWVIIVPNLV